MIQNKVVLVGIIIGIMLPSEKVFFEKLKYLKMLFSN